MQRYDVIIVGGGAAGLLCAGFAAAHGKTVLVAEKMERPGRKLLITGKGRCNVTNNCEEDAFIRHVRTNPRFLYSAIHAFSPRDTMRLFEQAGVPLKTERGNRVFPVSDRAADIVDALVDFAVGSGAQLVRCECRSLILEQGRAVGIRGAAGEAYYAQSVVIATGGMSYPRTGSTGDGYRLAESAGHTIVPPRPSLIPLIIQETCCRDMMGLSLRNVTLRLEDKQKSKVVFEELGEMLFTHFGVSGPLVLSASSHMSGEAQRYLLHLDLKPGLTAQQLDARLLRDFEKFSNRDFIHALGELLPRKLIPVVVRRCDIPFTTKVHQITREQRLRLVTLLKDFTLSPCGFRPIEEAIVTSGGVQVSQVDPKTMQSRLTPGLYFAGEVLDLDAYTGGFNLQIAFSTAYLAAQSV